MATVPTVAFFFGARSSARAASQSPEDRVVRLALGDLLEGNRR